MGDANSSVPVGERVSPRRSFFRRLCRFGVRLVVGYFLVVVLMMWLETLLIFPTWQIPEGDWDPAGFTYEDVEFTSEDGTKLNGWYFPHADPRGYVVYYHGNGEHLGHMGDYLSNIRDEYEISVFAVDYRGYGRSEGKPHEEGVLADGRAAQNWLAARVHRPPTELILWGRSIGGAVAVHVAVDQGARALILERTFTNLPDVAAPRYWWLPVRKLMRNRFDSLAKIPSYTGPLLQSHGTADEIVPFALGKQLFEAAGSEQKRFVVMPGVSHNASNTEEYYTELGNFIGQQCVARAEGRE